MPNKKGLINAYDAALIYKVSQATIYRWVKNDKITPIPHDGKFYYEVDALQNAYEKRNNKPSFSNKEWAKKNPIQAAEIVSKFQSENLNKLREKLRADLLENNSAEDYVKKILERSEGSENVRQARLKKVPRDKTTFQDVLDKYGHICYLCNEKIDLTERRGRRTGLHIDHVIPIAKGGHDTIENKRPTHAKCNLAKRDKLIWQKPKYDLPSI